MPLNSILHDLDADHGLLTIRFWLRPVSLTEIILITHRKDNKLN